MSLPAPQTKKEHQHVEAGGAGLPSIGSQGAVSRYGRICPVCGGPVEDKADVFETPERRWDWGVKCGARR